MMGQENLNADTDSCECSAVDCTSTALRRATWKLLELKSQKSEISSSRLTRVCFCELKHSDLVQECGSVELLAIIDKTKAQRSNRDVKHNE